MSCHSMVDWGLPLKCPPFFPSFRLLLRILQFLGSQLRLRLLSHIGILRFFIADVNSNQSYFFAHFQSRFLSCKATECGMSGFTVGTNFVDAIPAKKGRLKMYILGRLLVSDSTTLIETKLDYICLSIDAHNSWINIRLFIHLFTYLFIYLPNYLFFNWYTLIYVCIYMYVYICIYICIYI